MRADRILAERLADDGTHVVALREEKGERLDLLLLSHRDHAGRQLLVGLENDLARLRIDDVGGGEGTLESLVRYGDRLDPGLAQRRDPVGADLLAGLDRHVAGLHLAGRAESQQAVIDSPLERLALVQEDVVDRIERSNDLVGAAQSERAQKDRRQELSLPVDANVEQVLLFELILAANYMDIKPLLDLTCATVASMIKGKTPEEIRQTFNITNDFSPEEEAQVREENKWCEEA